MIDLSFYTRALAHGDAYVVPEALCAFRIHDASYSVVHAKLQGEGFSRYIDEVVAGGAFPVPAHAVAVGKCMSYVGAGVRQLYYRLFMGKRG
jgi:hypothetical protein